MSALFHLVEAATALSRLGETELSPSSAYRASYSSDISSTSQNISNAAHIPQLATTSVNNDDCMLASSEMVSTTFANKLRDNHLQALCAAAASAGLSTTMTPVDATAALRTAAEQAGLMNNHTPRFVNTATPTTLLNTQQVLSELKSSIAAAMNSSPLKQVNVVSSDVSAASSKDIFPSRLHSVLADPTVRDIITWLPHGKSFVVLRPDVFVNQVLPRYFPAEGTKRVTGANDTAISIEGGHKYPSFTRKLNRWGFRQISRGPDAGAFCHDLFQRDDPSLCRGMICQKSRKLSSNSSRSSGDDMMSVSSGSTMGTGNCSGSKSIMSAGNNITHDVTGKRLYSSTVTVSTAGNNSSNNNGVSNNTNRNLPLKKRKTSNNVSSSSKTLNDIPSMISHGYQKMAKSSSGTLSMSESLTSNSDNGSIGSDGGINSKVNATFAPCLLVPNGMPSSSSNAVDVMAMKEALARHFQEQQCLFAMQSLLENSRLAMEAAGIVAQMSTSSNQQFQDYPVPVSAPVFVTPTVIDDRKPAAAIILSAATDAAPPTASLSSSEAAKAELYKAFQEAMNRPLTPQAAASSSS